MNNNPHTKVPDGTYTPKINYDGCKCGHDWILHSNSVSSNLILIFSYLGIVSVWITPVFFFNMMTLTAIGLMLGIGIPLWIASCVAITRYVFNQRDRHCDLCTCNKFESLPRPYQ